MTSYLDEFLTNPGKVAAEIKEEMTKGVDEGELSVEEKQELEPLLEPPEAASLHPPSTTLLRGEGSSGEIRRSVEEEIRDKKDAYGRDLTEVRDEEEEEVMSWKGARSLEGDERSSDRESSLSLLLQGQEEIKAYCEQNFSLLNSTLVALQDRIARLEAREAPSIPLTALSGSPPRLHRSSLPGIEKAAHSGSGGGGGSRKLRTTISKVGVEKFLRDNRIYPSFKGVRMAKIRALALGFGLSSFDRDLSPSEWTVEGIVAALGG